MKIAIIGSFPHAAKEQIINRFPEAWEVRILHPVSYTHLTFGTAQLNEPLSVAAAHHGGNADFA